MLAVQKKKKEWHQDWAFYPHTNDDLLAVGVAIDDMAVEVFYFCLFGKKKQTTTHEKRN